MTTWARVDPSATSGQAPVALGGSIDASSLLDAYRHGFFPLPTDDPQAVRTNEALYGAAVEHGEVALLPSDHPLGPFATSWWNPPRRPLLRPDSVRLSRNLHKFLRNRCRWRTTADQAFEAVLDGCSEGRRIRWLTGALCESLLQLHLEGWAHSVEVWDEDTLVGGLFGIGTGSVLSIDSMFHRVSDAGWVAVADACARLPQRDELIVDLQWPQPFVERMGAEWTGRDHYLALLTGGLGPIEVVSGPFEAARLGRGRAQPNGAHR